MRILVAYASCHGSTAEIAGRIANVLRSSGDAVECRPMKEVSDLSAYDAVVAGSAIHDQEWLTEASAFMSRLSPALTVLPVWLFSVGMPAALPGRIQGWAMQEEDQMAAKMSAFVTPRGHRLFSGVVLKEHLSPGGRAKFRLMGGRYGDFRDWQEIDTWAAGVAEDLHPTVRQSSVR
ncbi:MAG TPA: flavodoxin domain-containing protein [Acidimicrobiales bacterium]|nr:flavodoxin domain-containing protein [Acidimicrobiales bacterium]